MTVALMVLSLTLANMLGIVSLRRGMLRPFLWYFHPCPKPLALDVARSHCGDTLSLLPSQFPW